MYRRVLGSAIHNTTYHKTNGRVNELSGMYSQSGIFAAIKSEL
jgi:hypothetical protein